MALLHLLSAHWLIYDWCLGKDDIQFCSHVVDQHVCLHCLPVSARTHLCNWFSCSITHGLIILKFEKNISQIQERFGTLYYAPKEYLVPILFINLNMYHNYSMSYHVSVIVRRSRGFWNLLKSWLLQ